MERSKLPDLQQSYPAVADSVAAGRRAIARFAADAGATPDQVDAVRLVASEALTNVVKHAYPDSGGRIEITAAVACDELCILIGDEGLGIRPHPGHGGLGLGLMLIASLCDELQIVNRSSGGTDLWLWLRLKTGATIGGQPRGSVASATAPADRRFSTTTQPAPVTSTVSSPGTS